MNLNFKGKNILVTGGSRGIGRAICEQFLASGGNVHATATSPKSFPKDFPRDISKHEVDFSSNESTATFLDKVSSLNIDVLVNNAGINKINLLEDISDEDWDLIQKVNLRAPFLVMKACLPHMRSKSWGRMVSVTSIFGNITKSQRLSYSTSKFGLHGMSKAAAMDYAKDNILINCIGPGFIDTELTRRVLGDDEIKELVSGVPMQRLGQPKEIANHVVFLCSEHNSFMTGQNLMVDGGFTCV